MPMLSTRGMLAALMPVRNGTPHIASSNPNTPPSALNTRLSVSSWRTVAIGLLQAQHVWRTHCYARRLAQAKGSLRWRRRSATRNQPQTTRRSKLAERVPLSVRAKGRDECPSRIRRRIGGGHSARDCLHLGAGFGWRDTFFQSPDHAQETSAANYLVRLRNERHIKICVRRWIIDPFRQDADYRIAFAIDIQRATDKPRGPRHIAAAIACGSVYRQAPRPVALPMRENRAR